MSQVDPYLASLLAESERLIKKLADRPAAAANHPKASSSQARPPPLTQPRAQPPRFGSSFSSTSGTGDQLRLVGALILSILAILVLILLAR